MSPDSIETYRQLTAAMDLMQRDIADIKVALGRLETKLTTICAQRSQEHAECEQTKNGFQARWDAHAHEHERLWESMHTLSVKWKVAAGLGGGIIVLLTIINTALALMVKL